MKYTSEQEREIKVKFKFRKINYYRIQRETGERIGEAQGEMSLRLFKSWFKFMNRKKQLLCGILQFVESGETWIWQPENDYKNPKWFNRGGWQKALDGNRADYDPERDGLNVHTTYLERIGIGNDIVERMRG